MTYITTPVLTFDNIEDINNGKIKLDKGQWVQFKGEPSKWRYCGLTKHNHSIFSYTYKEIGVVQDRMDGKMPMFQLLCKATRVAQ